MTQTQKQKIKIRSVIDADANKVFAIISASTGMPKSEIIGQILNEYALAFKIEDLEKYKFNNN